MTASAPALTPVVGTLHALQVPIPYPMKTVTVLIDAPRQGPVTLIDTALDTPEARQAIEDGLSAFGLHWPDVERVIVTHHHPDHYGLAGVVEERSGAAVQMLDVEIGRGERYWHLWEEWLPGHIKHMADHGLPPNCWRLSNSTAAGARRASTRRAASSRCARASTSPWQVRSGRCCGFPATRTGTWGCGTSRRAC